MLGKLLKYEFKATARLFLPLYLALLAFALINCFLQVLFPCFCRHLLQQPPRGIYV